jgi:hypothetical protein
MVKINSNDKIMCIDISNSSGMSLANLVLHAIYTYACETEESRANIQNVKDMLNNGKTWIDVDLGVDND